MEGTLTLLLLRQRPLQEHYGRGKGEDPRYAMSALASTGSCTSPGYELLRYRQCITNGSNRTSGLDTRMTV